MFIFFLVYCYILSIIKYVYFKLWHYNYSQCFLPSGVTVYFRSCSTVTQGESDVVAHRSIHACCDTDTRVATRSVQDIPY